MPIMLTDTVSELAVNMIELNPDWIVTCLSILHGMPCYSP